MLEPDIRTGDRPNLLDYAHHVALDRIDEGFPLVEVCATLRTTANYLDEVLQAEIELGNFEQRIQDNGGSDYPNGFG